MPKAYVLLSGGVDSTTALAIADQEYDGRVCAVSINYGQRHTVELKRAEQIAAYYNHQHVIRDVGDLIQKGGLTDPSLEMPEVSYDELPEGVSPTYVPFRNGTMLALIAGMASCDPEAEAVYVGVHAEDGQNWAYPDCTPEFIGGMANAIYIGTYHKIRLIAPLLYMKKYQVIEAGNNLKKDVPWQMTWSCYEGRDLHCGVCPTCRARKEAFGLARASGDPTPYEDDEWNIEIAP